MRAGSAPEVGFRRLFLLTLVTALTVLAGCASVPMASSERDIAAKQFALPAPDKAALYVFRNSRYGSALVKMLWLDAKIIGATAPMTYFCIEITPGTHTLTTQSEFGDNSITFEAAVGQNRYARQYIKLGVFVGGAGLEMVSEEEGKKGVLECKLAQAQQ